jgi:hypothetical protein
MNEDKMKAQAKEIARASRVDSVFNEIKRYADMALPLVMVRENNNKNVTNKDIATDSWLIAEAMYAEGTSVYKRVVSQIEKDQSNPKR